MKVMLAPMAGVTDLPFRLMVRKYSKIDLAFTEMVSAKAMHYNDKKTFDLLQTCESDVLLSVQIFGHEPEIMAEAAEKICELGKASEININMGCPAKKIIKNSDGARLMQDIHLASDIIKSVVKSSKLPVSVKTRLGWDKVNVLDFAKMAEDAGAEYLIVHGRTAVQEYRGKADWDEIYNLADKVRIPIVGNGDLKKIEDSNLHGIMIGRAFMGNPALSETQNVKLALEHLELMREYKPKRNGVLESRKQMAWYFKNAIARQEIMKANSYDEMERIVEKAISYLDC